jgi:hypothetical protein
MLTIYESESTLYKDYDSDSENRHPSQPLYYIHSMTDTEAETVLEFEPAGSWILRENPYSITIRIEDGYIHHTNMDIQFQAIPEVYEYSDDSSEPTQSYLTFSYYLNHLSDIYGIDKRKQIVLKHRIWHQKRHGDA